MQMEAQKQLQEGAERVQKLTKEAAEAANAASAAAKAAGEARQAVPVVTPPLSNPGTSTPAGWAPEKILPSAGQLQTQAIQRTSVHSVTESVMQDAVAASASDAQMSRPPSKQS